MFGENGTLARDGWMDLKVAYVTPRYGEEVVGGAEHAARMLAERLTTQLDWTVEAFTSCALDAGTWANELSPGDAQVNGVEVHRFSTAAPRSREFLDLSWRVHRNPKLAHPRDQQRWIDMQGPLVPELMEAVADSSADVVVFYPYLYYPTVRGLPRVTERSVLHPAAHDEAAIRMSVFAPVFAQASGFVFQTDGERRLAERLFPIADRPQLLLGLGVEPQAGDESGFRERLGLGDRRYVLCLGRVDAGKGSMLLTKYFAEYKRRHDDDLALVYVGPVMQQVEEHPDVFVAGIVSESDKWSALRGCAVLVSPSPFEAFSLALIEAWSADRPVLVNRACVATREHVERSGGGLSFDGFASFDVMLRKIVDDPELASSLAVAGRRYVDARFLWPALIERYGAFLTRVAERSGKQVAS